jgi:hypothetical protein
MLVDVTIREEYDEISALISKINGNSNKIIHPETGIYEIGHFNFDHDFKENCKRWSALSDLSINGYLNCYGVCDTYKQILEQYPGIITSDRKFVISITPILKENQSKKGGWRWYKWGSYIGKHTPITEYLYDDPSIDKVYVYTIYELV